jgi:uncharacterized protein with GYD domain
MPTYVSLIRWTAKGRESTASLPDRVAEVEKRLQSQGVKLVGTWVTMGRYDQVSILEAPDDEAVAKAALEVAGRGNAVTETLRGFSMDEVRKLV